MIATPAYGGVVSTAYLESLLALASSGLNLTLMVINKESLVSRARNTCVASFLDDESYTHLLFIDADIGFSLDGVRRLFAKDAPVVAGTYPKKNINWHQAYESGASSADDLRLRALDYVINTHVVDEMLEGESSDGAAVDGYRKVAYCGTGFLLIKREVFDVLRQTYPELQYVNDPGGFYSRAPAQEHYWAFFESMIHPRSKRYLSEDFGFCYRWRTCGGEIWVDCRSRLTHVGVYDFVGDLRGEEAGWPAVPPEAE
jgi:hypothetical protein